MLYSNSSLKNFKYMLVSKILVTNNHFNRKFNQTHCRDYIWDAFLRKTRCMILCLWDFPISICTGQLVILLFTLSSPTVSNCNFQTCKYLLLSSKLKAITERRDLVHKLYNLLILQNWTKWTWKHTYKDWSSSQHIA